jgi:hypothetical protein
MSEQDNPYSEENSPRRYFEYMEELRLNHIQELEEQISYLKREMTEEQRVKELRDKIRFAEMQVLHYTKIKMQTEEQLNAHYANNQVQGIQKGSGPKEGHKDTPKGKGS